MWWRVVGTYCDRNGDVYEADLRINAASSAEAQADAETLREFSREHYGAGYNFLEGTLWWGYGPVITPVPTHFTGPCPAFGSPEAEQFIAACRQLTLVRVCPVCGGHGTDEYGECLSCAGGRPLTGWEWLDRGYSPDEVLAWPTPEVRHDAPTV